MDFLDILNGTGTQTYRGEYYRERTAEIGIEQTPTLSEIENPIPFFYETVDNQRSYAQPLPNMYDRQNEEVTIKTKDGIFYGKQLEGFVKLQDGYFYQIVTISVDRRGISKQAALFTPTPVGADYVLRLTKIDNPFKVYETQAPQTATIPCYAITYSYGMGTYPYGINPTLIWENVPATFSIDGALGYAQATVTGATKTLVRQYRDGAKYISEYSLTNPTANVTVSVIGVLPEEYNITYTYGTECSAYGENPTTITEIFGEETIKVQTTALGELQVSVTGAEITSRAEVEGHYEFTISNATADVTFNATLTR